MPKGCKNIYENAQWWSEFKNIQEYQPANTITYTSSDGTVVTPAFTDVFGANIISNEYKGGKGKITFDGDVLSIGDKAFYGSKTLNSIIIPSSVTAIGASAFEGCSSLSSIDIPAGVNAIGVGAFKGCSGLATINLPDGITELGIEVFDGCISLASIEIPSSVISISDYAFRGCSSLTKITIPSSVSSIGSYVFQGCVGLKYMFATEDIARCQTKSFDGITETCALYIPKGSESAYQTAEGWKEFNNILEFHQPTNVITYTTNDGKAITMYGYTGFGAHYLSNEYKDGKGVITFDGDVTSIGDNAFSSRSNLTSIDLPVCVTSIGENAFYGSSFLTSIEIPWGVTSIGKGAFSDCNSLTSITLSANINSIEDYTFYRCRSLASIVLPANVTNIGTGAFKDCSSLISISIPSSVTSIGTGAFEDCSELTSIELPSSLTTIGDNAFMGCSSLTSVVLPESITCITSALFRGCSSLTSVELPSGVTSIGNYAFYGCSTLPSITIPSGVTSIGNNAFYSCKGLTTISIPSSVTSIGDWAFTSCDNLGSIYVTEVIAKCESSTFAYIIWSCILYVPTNCKSAYQNAEIWKEFDNIREYQSPNSIVYTSYDEQVVMPIADAFDVKIKSNEYKNGKGVITFDGDVTSIGAEAFANCESLTMISIPSGVTSISSNAFKGCYFSTFENLSSLSGEENNYWGAVLVDQRTEDGLLIKDNAVIKYVQVSNSVTIPSNITNIEAGVFAGHDLASIVVAEGNEVYDSRDNCNAVIETATNELIVGFGSTVIPLSVTGIGDSAFAGCGSLTSIEIPSNICSIGNRAFEGCTDLTSMYVTNSIAQCGSESPFDGITTTCTLYVPRSCSYAYQHAEHWREFTTIEEYDLGGSYTLIYKSTDGEVVIPQSSEVFGAGIISNTYQNGQGIIVFDGDVTSIGDYAFQSCSSLQTIEIPSSVTHIGVEAFDGCNLSSIVVAEGNEVYDSRDNCNAIVETATDELIIGCGTTVIPSTVNAIGSYAFAGCNDLNMMLIPSSVTHLGDYAFSGCEKLTTIISMALVPPTLGSTPFSVYDCLYVPAESLEAYRTAEGWRNFYTIMSIENPSIYFEVDNIRYSITDVLRKTVAVTSSEYSGDVVIPASVSYGGNDYVVTSIESSAFAGCRLLTSIVIPSSVIFIGEGAFTGCYFLKDKFVNNTTLTSLDNWGAILADVITEDGLVFVDNIVVGYIGTATTISIPSGIIGIDNTAFSGCRDLKEIEIPSTVEYLGGFSDTGLEKIVIHGHPFIRVNGPEGAFPSTLKTVYCLSTIPPVCGEYNLEPGISCGIFGQNTNDDLISIACDVYVWATCLDAYYSASQWRICTIHAIPEDIVINDTMTSFMQSRDIECTTLTYTRTFNDTEWQPLYVPFAMSYGDWENDFDVAFINNMNQYDTDGDNLPDVTIMEIFKLVEGEEVEPNTPYLIRAKEEGQKSFIFSNATLYKAEENTFDVASWDLLFEFTGVYHQISGSIMQDNGYYMMSEGSMLMAGSDDDDLGAFRWYMKVTDHNGTLQKLGTVRILEYGDDFSDLNPATLLPGDANGAIFSLGGTKLIPSTKGIQIRNGEVIFLR